MLSDQPILGDATMLILTLWPACLARRGVSYPAIWKQQLSVLSDISESYWRFDFNVFPFVAPTPGFQDGNRQAFRKTKQGNFSHTAPEFLCLLLTCKHWGLLWNLAVLALPSRWQRCHTAEAPIPSSPTSSVNAIDQSVLRWWEVIG